MGSLLLFSSMTPILHAGTITVDTNEIGIASDGHCDIIEAIHTANGDIGTEDCTIAGSTGDADTIVFTPDISTIALTAPDNEGVDGDSGGNGLPVITSDIAIQGGSGVTLTRSSDADFRILEVDGRDTTDSQLTLDNVTIHNGKTSNTFGNSFYGGGLFLHDNAALTLTNSTIISNVAGDDGGGIFASDSSTVTVNNSTITSNMAPYDGGSGGGILASSSSVQVDSSILTSNIAGSNGGGILAARNSTVMVNNSTIVSNSVGRSGGGIYVFGDILIEIYDSSIISNSAEADGGGIYAYDASVTIIKSNVTSNSARYSGGGITSHGRAFYHNPSSYDDEVKIVHSTIAYNNTDGRGGGIRIGNSNNPLLVENSTIMSNNSQSNGGGIYAEYSPVTVENSTIMSNNSQSSGGGVFSASSPVTIENSTILSNTAQSSGGGIWSKRSYPLKVVNSTIGFNYAQGSGGGILASLGTASVTNSNILSNTAVAQGGALYWNEGTDMTIENSCIVSNSTNAIHNNVTSDINAQSNWWGAADGPGGVSSGSGDAVGQRVDFRNFLTKPPLSCSIRGLGDSLDKNVFLPFISGG